jgi:signal transduction histidine kinase
VKKIKIRNEIRGDKVRVTVFNTLEGLPDEVLNHIWNRFYKADESRNRSKGGNGIGLAIVKAIMNNYNNDFGAKNVAGGVEFYFEIDLEKEA